MDFFGLFLTPVTSRRTVPLIRFAMVRIWKLTLMLQIRTHYFLAFPRSGSETINTELDTSSFVALYAIEFFFRKLLSAYFLPLVNCWFGTRWKLFISTGCITKRACVSSVSISNSIVLVNWKNCRDLASNFCQRPQCTHYTSTTTMNDFQNYFAMQELVICTLT
jgi:hypothetical protein